jgi:hypothetical protein
MKSTDKLTEMALELAQKYHDAMVQKLLWRSSTQKVKDLAQEIRDVSDHVSECYPSLTPKFFGFTFVFEDDNVYLEFLLDEDVPDGVEKRHVLFSIEELRKVAMLNTHYVAAKILNKAKEVTRHDTLLKSGYIPVFWFCVGFVVDEDIFLDREYFVGDKKHYYLFSDIYYGLYWFMRKLVFYYDAGYMYCVVSQIKPACVSETIVPYEPEPLSCDVFNFRVLDVVIKDNKFGSLFFCYEFGQECIGKVEDISLDMLLDYIIEAVVRAKEIYKALNRTFDAVYMRFYLTKYRLQSIKGLNEFLENVPYKTHLETPTIFFSR